MKNAGRVPGVGFEPPEGLWPQSGLKPHPPPQTRGYYTSGEGRVNSFENDV